MVVIRHHGEIIILWMKHKLPFNLPESDVVHILLILESLQVHFHRVSSTVHIAQPIADGFIYTVNIHSALPMGF